MSDDSDTAPPPALLPAKSTIAQRVGRRRGNNREQWVEEWQVFVPRPEPTDTTAAEEVDSGAETEEAEVEEFDDGEMRWTREDGKWRHAWCSVCMDGGHLMCCDGCPKVYHLSCLDPPLEAVPLGKWYCTACWGEEATPTPTTTTRGSRRRGLQRAVSEFLPKGGSVVELSDDESDDEEQEQRPVRRVKQESDSDTVSRPTKRQRTGRTSRKVRGATKVKTKRVRRSTQKKVRRRGDVPVDPSKPRRMVVELLEKDVESTVDAVAHPWLKGVEGGAGAGGDDKECCSRCSSRDCFKAVFLQDELMLRDLVWKSSVALPFIRWSPDVSDTILQKAIRSGADGMLRCVLRMVFLRQDWQWPERGGSFESLSGLVQRGWGTKCSLPRNNLHRESGSVSMEFLGKKVGPVGVARGGKEGNNAFTKDNDGSVPHFHRNRLFRDLVQTALSCGSSRDVFDALWDVFPAEASGYVAENCIGDSARFGRIDLLMEHLVDLHTRTGFGFGELHLAVLKGPDAALPSWTTIRSVTKKADASYSITPVHLAAINPTTCEPLKALMQDAKQKLGNLDVDLVDSSKRTPLHYAAANRGKGRECVQLLLELGLDPLVEDENNITPLQVAVEVNAPDVVELLVERVMERRKRLAQVEQEQQVMEVEEEKKEAEDKASKAAAKIKAKREKTALQNAVHGKNKHTGQTLLHVAARLGHTRVLDKLIDLGGNVMVKDKEKLTPFALAAQLGNVDVLKLLLRKGPARQLTHGDKRKRLPVHQAAMNGHFLCVKLLLLQGSPCWARDTSGNTIAHYAAAYGWADIVKLLHTAVCDVGAFNDWKFTPLSLAVAKGHMGVASALLDLGVDVNVCDSEGRTVLHHCMSLKTDDPDSLLVQLTLLVQEKHADVSVVVPATGCTVLHMLANQPATRLDLSMAEILLHAGADPFLLNKDGRSAFLLAVRQQNIKLMDRFLDYATEHQVHKRAQHKKDVDAMEEEEEEEEEGESDVHPAWAADSDGLNALDYIIKARTAHLPADQAQGLDHHQLTIKQQAFQREWATHRLCFTRRMLTLPGVDAAAQLRKEVAGLSVLHTLLSIDDDVELCQVLIESGADVNQCLLKTTTIRVRVDTTPTVDVVDAMEESDDDDAEEEAEEQSAVSTEESESEEESDSEDEEEKHQEEGVEYQEKEVVSHRVSCLMTVLDRCSSEYKSLTPILILLLEAGAVVDFRDHAGNSVVARAVLSSLCLQVDLDTIPSYLRELPQLRVQREAHLDILRRVLAKCCKKTLNERNEQGQLLLWQVVRRQYPEATVALLLDNGCDASGAEGDNNLFRVACESRCRVTVLRRLAQAGAVVDNRVDDWSNVAHFLVPLCLSEFGYAHPALGVLVEMYSEEMKALCAGVDREGYTPLLLAFRRFTCAGRLLDGDQEFRRVLDTLQPFVNFNQQVAAATPKRVPKHLLTSAQRKAARQKRKQEIEEKKRPHCKHGVLCFGLAEHRRRFYHPRRVLGAHQGFAALHFVASRACDTPLATYLLKSGADVNVTDAKGRRPLHLVVAESSHMDMVKLFMERGADVSAACEHGHTALHGAVDFSSRHALDSQRGFQRAFQVESALMAAGADLNVKDSYGRTPLHYAFVRVGQKYISKGARRDNIELISDLCAFDHIDGDVHDVWGRSPLHYAAMLGARISAKTLLSKGATPASVDKDGNQTFHHALLHEHVDFAEDTVQLAELAAPLANYMQRGRHESVFRYVLAREGWMGLAYLMIRRGLEITRAVADALSHEKFQLVLTMIHKASSVHTKDEDTGRSLFHVLCAYVPKSDVARQAFNSWEWGLYFCDSLLRQEVDVCSRDAVLQSLPLHLAITNAHKALVEFLLDRHPDTIKDMEGKTDLSCTTLAVRTRDVPFVRKLLSRGAPVDMGRLEGQSAVTPLLVAVKNSHEDMVQCLLTAGANVDLCRTDTKDGNNPVMEAVRSRNGDILERLLNAGGKTDIGCLEGKVTVKDKEKKEEERKDDDDELHTPLSYAVLHNAQSVVAVLTAHGADVHVRCQDGEPLFHRAVRRCIDGKCTPGIVALLLNAGADPNVSWLDQSPLVRAVRAGHVGVMALLLFGCTKGGNDHALDMSWRDEQGWTALHWAVSPNGAYQASPEDGQLVQMLLRCNDHGFWDFYLRQLVFEAVSASMFVDVHTEAGGGGWWSQSSSERWEWERVDTVYLSRSAEHDTIVPDRSCRGQQATGMDALLEDKEGRSAAWYAAVQQSGVLFGLLSTTLAAVETEKLLREARAFAGGLQQEEEECFVEKERVYGAAAQNVQLDSDRDARDMQARYLVDEESMEGMDETLLEPVSVDSEANLPPECTVLHTAEEGLLHAAMAKTDTRQGRFGTHSFYRMQLVWNPIQSMVVMITRWGRVGETGMHQTTPFPSKEDAVKDFCKLFKTKTGNAWQDRSVKLFTPVDDKWQLVRTRRRIKEPTNGETGEPLELVSSVADVMRVKGASCPSSRLPRPLFSLLSSVCNAGQIKESLRKVGVHELDSPLGEITDAVLDQAHAMLLEIHSLLDDKEELESSQRDILSQTHQLDQKLRDRRRDQARATALASLTGAVQVEREVIPPSQAPVPPVQAQDSSKPAEEDEEEKEIQRDLERIHQRAAANREQLADKESTIASISDKFFTHVPCAMFVSGSIEPLNTRKKLFTQVTMVLRLKELQIGTKMLLGAQFRATEVNPVDYCYLALGVGLVHVNQESVEYKRVLQYAAVTGSVRKETFHVFSLRRTGDEERFRQELHNRRLLWHGSDTGNFCGILSRGLRIAPPEADPHGYNFGKGVYFSDSFAKSLAYTGNSYDSSSLKVLVLSEVALGNVHRIRHPSFVTELPEDKHSVLGMGRQSPVKRRCLTTIQGVTIPLGGRVDTDGSLHDNEFIVYKEEQCRMRYLVVVGDLGISSASDDR